MTWEPYYTSNLAHIYEFNLMFTSFASLADSAGYPTTGQAWPR